MKYRYRYQHLIIVVLIESILLDWLIFHNFSDFTRLTVISAITGMFITGFGHRHPCSSHRSRSVFSCYLQLDSIWQLVSEFYHILLLEPGVGLVSRACRMVCVSDYCSVCAASK